VEQASAEIESLMWQLFCVYEKRSETKESFSLQREFEIKSAGSPLPRSSLPDAYDSAANASTGVKGVPSSALQPQNLRLDATKRGISSPWWTRKLLRD
jgi:hypothetical protein